MKRTRLKGSGFFTAGSRFVILYFLDPATEYIIPFRFKTIKTYTKNDRKFKTNRTRGAIGLTTGMTSETVAKRNQMRPFTQNKFISD